eukprot:scaffold39217_cov27-Prasinocladus_malaysianus.AAC.1
MVSPSSPSKLIFVTPAALTTLISTKAEQQAREPRHLNGRTPSPEPGPLGRMPCNLVEASSESGSDSPAAPFTPPLQQQRPLWQTAPTQLQRPNKTLLQLVELFSVSAAPKAQEAAWKIQRAQIQANCLPELIGATETLESQDMVARQITAPSMTNDAARAISVAPAPNIRPDRRAKAASP